MSILLTLLSVHFVADFILQNDWMAINKSRRWDALTIHVVVYSMAFAVIFGVKFGIITFLTHFITDAVTSRLTRRLYWLEPMPVEYMPRDTVHRGGRVLYWDLDDGRWHSRHWFFVVIGLDQLIHFYTLVWTLGYLGG